MPALAQVELPLDTADLPALIILGRDETNKAHAAWFDQSEVVAATRAAELMTMMALPVLGGQLQALAGRLPHGKIFSASGRAFVPFVKQATYDELIGHVPMAQQVKPLRLVRAEAEGVDSDPTANQVTPPASPAPGQSDVGGMTAPSDWSKVGPGCVVLAVSDDKAEGWFESVILKAKGTTFTLRWRDYDAPHFERELSGIALMHISRGTNA